MQQTMKNWEPFKPQENAAKGCKVPTPVWYLFLECWHWHSRTLIETLKCEQGVHAYREAETADHSEIAWLKQSLQIWSPCQELKGDLGTDVI